MVLNDIIEQAAGRHSRASERGGKHCLNCWCYPNIFWFYENKYFIFNFFLFCLENEK